MPTPWEIVSKGMLPPPALLRRNLAGALALLKVMRANPDAVRVARQRQGPPLYRRPERPYSLPEFKAGMVNRSTEERYLRPTLYCDCRAPLITALAYRLGVAEKTPREYADAAFEFVKRNIAFEIAPLCDVAEVLRVGAGTCMHKISLFIALCRAGGLPARYKFFTLTVTDDFMEPEFARSPLFKLWYDAMGSFLLHGQGEVRIDGAWISADVNIDPLRQAATGLPLTCLGEDSVGIWLFPVPGTTFWKESIPIGLAGSSRFVMRHLAAAVDGFNSGIGVQVEQGRRVIAAAGGEAAYDAEARRRRGPGAARNELASAHERITFERD
jgi:hypothetical protein